MKATTLTADEKQAPKYLAAIADYLKEMAAIRQSMKRTDAEIRRLESSSRRKLDETWAIIRRVEATL
jgi:hypothetical protein